ncbi:MAG: hypothetical protein AABX30_02255 [Nanoarchaeota archaeon]
MECNVRIHLWHSSDKKFGGYHYYESERFCDFQIEIPKEFYPVGEIKSLTLGPFAIQDVQGGNRNFSLPLGNVERVEYPLNKNPLIHTKLLGSSVVMSLYPLFHCSGSKEDEDKLTFEIYRRILQKIKKSRLVPHNNQLEISLGDINPLLTLH